MIMIISKSLRISCQFLLYNTTVKGCKKVGIVEVFGMMGNEEYQEKTRLKEQYARENEDKFVFLTWKPQTESEEDLLNRLVRCISDIRKSAYANKHNLLD